MLIRCDAILFDMDGTIIDSHAAVVRMWHWWAAKHGLDGDALVELSHGRRTIEAMRAAAPHLDCEAELIPFLAQEASDLDGVVAMPGALELTRALPAKRWAVVTSSSASVAQARLAYCGFPQPGAIVAADHVTQGKPHPEPFLRAAELLGCRPERCIVFEDANAGLCAARAAGMQAIGITYRADAELDCAHSVHSLADVRLSLDDGIVLTLNLNGG